MQEIRNIAIIAHVDHGKTTLVDKIIYYSQLLRETEEKVDLIHKWDNLGFQFLSDPPQVSVLCNFGLIFLDFIFVLV